MTLHLSGVSLTHGNGVHALRGLDLHIGANEQVAIIGPSGAGKSSLLNLLATALRPSSGELQVLGERAWHLSARQRQRLRARIGLVHQAPPLPPRQRVVTAVLAGKLGQWSLGKACSTCCIRWTFPAPARPWPGWTWRQTVRAVPAVVRRPVAARGHCPGAVSGPEVLLADEPVSAMDPVLAEHTLSVLCRHAREHNVTLVASLHAVELALAHFPRIIGLRDGQILFDLPASRSPRPARHALRQRTTAISPVRRALTVQIPDADA
jgi:phosphonate transport system ATP-binding protein